MARIYKSKAYLIMMVNLFSPGNEQIVETLLRNGAQANAKDNDGLPVLSWASLIKGDSYLLNITNVF